MSTPRLPRYEQVSRRALLKGSLAAGVVVMLPACGNSDAEVFANAAAQPVANATPTPFPTPAETNESEAAAPTEPPATDPAETPTADTTPTLAVAGEMVIGFTYTQAAGGKNERPYIAVWIEDAAGDLAQTISLWYQVERRGERWLDHLNRWFPADADRVAQGGADNSATISSATREAGTYAVAWDGAIEGTPALPGDYFVCIEAVREEGPYSLIREPLTLSGTLAELSLPDNGELSTATVRIDVPV